MDTLLNLTPDERSRLEQVRKQSIEWQRLHNETATPTPYDALQHDIVFLFSILNRLEGIRAPQQIATGRTTTAYQAGSDRV